MIVFYLRAPLKRSKNPSSLYFQRVGIKTVLSDVWAKSLWWKLIVVRHIRFNPTANLSTEAQEIPALFQIVDSKGLILEAGWYARWSVGRIAQRNLFLAMPYSCKWIIKRFHWPGDEAGLKDSSEIRAVQIRARSNLFLVVRRFYWRSAVAAFYVFFLNMF